MNLNKRFYNLFADRAQRVEVEQLYLGLGYTAVCTTDGGIGFAYTYFDRKSGCSLVNSYYDYEGKSAAELLEKIQSDDTIERSMALALINALNHKKSLSLPEDRNNEIVFEKLGVGENSHAAMVGFFGPLVKMLEKRKARVEVIDAFRGIGSPEAFFKKLSGWADVLFLTSTSILNNTIEQILEGVKADTKTALLGPSTPLVAEVFRDLPVHILAGTVPVEKDQVLKAVRHGLGTRYIHKFSKKSILIC